jgi:hypothetical protein
VVVTDDDISAKFVKIGCDAMSDMMDEAVEDTREFDSTAFAIAASGVNSASALSIAASLVDIRESLQVISGFMRMHFQGTKPKETDHG